MPARRLLMRKIREVLRLRHEQGLSHQAVARVCAIGVGTVNRYLRRAVEAGLGWPLPVELDDAALEARLFPRAAPVHERVRPECAHIHRELKRDGVTLQLLWEEYAQVHSHGYRYTQFCGKRTPRSGWNGWVMRICGASAAPDAVWSSDEGCGRGSCTSGPALDTRPTPRRDVLQPRRAEPGDPRPPGRAQRPAVEEARRQPPRPLRAARPSGPPAPAGHALRPRAVEAVPPQHRLLRHRRATRLQRAFQLLREQVESATPRRPSRSSSRAGACRRTGAATTDSRPPWPSTCRAPTAPTPSGHHRASSDRDTPTPSPGAGVQGRARTHAAGAAVRQPPARRRERPRHRPRLLPLPHRQEHPRHRPGPSAPGAAGRDGPDAHPRNIRGADYYAATNEEDRC